MTNLDSAILASQKLIETIRNLERVRLGGIFKDTVVLLTPSDVVRDSKYRPFFWDPRAEIMADVFVAAQTLLPVQYKSRTRGVYNMDIIQSSLEFPDACPVTLDKPDHYEVAEYVGGCKDLHLRKVGFNVSQDKAMRIKTALQCERWWAAIPFSTNHDLFDRAIWISNESPPTKQNQRRIYIKNREYARRFQKLNNLEDGKWLAPKHVIMRMIGFIGTWISLLVSGVLGGVIYSVLNGNSVITSLSFEPPVFVIGIISLAVNIYLIIKGFRGEPL